MSPRLALFTLLVANSPDTAIGKAIADFGYLSRAQRDRIMVIYYLLHTTMPPKPSNEQSRFAPQRMSDVSTPGAIHTTGGDIEVEMELAGLELPKVRSTCYHNYSRFCVGDD